MPKVNLKIVTILAIGLILRLVAINQSLWLDEAIGAIAVKTYTYWEILTQFSKFDNHPPLYYLTLKLWTDLFGYSELSLRLPSIIFGLGTIVLTYLIARLISDKNRFFHVLSALLIATSQFHIYYSQEARMYSMAAFFVALACFAFLALAKTGKNSSWVIFSFAITGMVLTDYMPVFLFPVFWIFSFFYKKEVRWWLPFLIAHIPIAILFYFWLPIFNVQAEAGRWLLNTVPGWRDIAGGATVKQVALVWMKFVLGRISYPNKIYYYVLVGLASIPAAISLIKALLKKNSQIGFAIMWLLLPLAAAYFASFWFPAFNYFRFTYVVPAFYILIAWGVATSEFDEVKKTLALILVGVNLFGWLSYVVDESQQREKWRHAVNFVEMRANENELAIFEYPKPFAPYLWYESGVIKSVGVTDSIYADPEKTKKITSETIKDREGVYYFEYLHDLSDPQNAVIQTLEEEGFAKKAVYNFSGVGQIFYWMK